VKQKCRTKASFSNQSKLLSMTMAAAAAIIIASNAYRRSLGIEKKVLRVHLVDNIARRMNIAHPIRFRDASLWHLFWIFVFTYFVIDPISIFSVLNITQWFSISRFQRKTRCVCKMLRFRLNHDWRRHEDPNRFIVAMIIAYEGETDIMTPNDENECSNAKDSNDGSFDGDLSLLLRLHHKRPVMAPWPWRRL
jgi:hypothetical protein